MQIHTFHHASSVARTFLPSLYSSQLVISGLLLPCLTVTYLPDSTLLSEAAG